MTFAGNYKKEYGEIDILTLQKPPEASFSVLVGQSSFLAFGMGGY
jgi:hypothetical protein